MKKLDLNDFDTKLKSLLTKLIDILKKEEINGEKTKEDPNKDVIKTKLKLDIEKIKNAITEARKKSTENQP